MVTFGPPPPSRELAEIGCQVNGLTEWHRTKCGKQRGTKWVLSQMLNSDHQEIKVPRNYRENNSNQNHNRMKVKTAECRKEIGKLLGLDQLDWIPFGPTIPVGFLIKFKFTNLYFVLIFVLQWTIFLSVDEIVFFLKR